MLLVTTLTNTTKIWISYLPRNIVSWSAKRPTFTLSLILCVCILLLPAVTVVALTPLAFIFTYTGILMSYGGTKILYTILFQGFLLAVLLVALFVIFFVLILFASVFHSYRTFFLNIGKIKSK